jgi:hypothetical protein
VALQNTTFKPETPREFGDLVHQDYVYEIRKEEQKAQELDIMAILVSPPRTPLQTKAVHFNLMGKIVIVRINCQLLCKECDCLSQIKLPPRNT